MELKVKTNTFLQPPKIWHKKPGDVVRLLNNDGTEPDLSFYLIVKQEHSITTIYMIYTPMKCVVYHVQYVVNNIML